MPPVPSADASVRSRRLITEIDHQIELLINIDVTPAQIVLDIDSFQILCQWTASQIDEAHESDNHATEPVTAYREIPITMLPQRQRLVSVVADPREVWDQMDVYLKTVSRG